MRVVLQGQPKVAGAGSAPQNVACMRVDASAFFLVSFHFCPALLKKAHTFSDRPIACRDHCNLHFCLLAVLSLFARKNSGPAFLLCWRTR